MAFDLREQRESLEREVSRLEDLLKADANWRALCALEAALADGGREATGVPDHAAERARLQTALRSNRVYCARERLREAIDLMDEEVTAAAEESDATTDLFQAGLTQVMTKDMTAGEAFKTRVKVKIHNAPPETDGAPKAAAADLPPDDLTRIRGINRTFDDKLKSLGVTRFEQIATWRAADVKVATSALGLGREISRENWIEQAAMLAAKDGRKIPAAEPVARCADDEAVLQLLDEPSGGEANIATVDHSPPPVEPRDGDPSQAATTGAAVGLAGLIAAAAARIATSAKAAVPDVPTPSAEADFSDEATVDEAVVDDVVEVDPPEPAAPDPLTAIRHIDEATESTLNAAGVTTFAQIASWTAADVARFETDLARDGLISSEGWIEQAAVLQSGGETVFARRQQTGHGAVLVPPPPLPALPDAAAQARLAERSALHPPPPAPEPEPEPEPVLAEPSAEPAAGDPAPELEATQDIDVASSSGDDIAGAPAVSAREEDASPEQGEDNSDEDTTVIPVAAGLATGVALAAGAAVISAANDDEGDNENDDDTTTVITTAPAPQDAIEDVSASEPSSDAVQAEAASEDEVDTEVVFMPPAETAHESKDVEAAEPATVASDPTTAEEDAEEDLEAEVKLVPKAQDGQESVAEPESGKSADDGDGVVTDATAPAFTSFNRRRRTEETPRWTEEDDDLPATADLTFEEASVEIVPLPAASDTPAREHDDPVPAPPATLPDVIAKAVPEDPSAAPITRQQTPAQVPPASAAPQPNQEKKAAKPSDREAVGRFLKALSGK